MAIHGPIILIEDNVHDLDLISEAFKELGIKNPILTFQTTQPALEYLLITTDQPFVIMCDILMPEKNGMDFRLSINTNDYLRQKSIPFLFFTGIVSEEIIKQCYDLGVQGFFEKPTDFETLKSQLSSIIDYWSKCLHPNNPNGN